MKVHIVEDEVSINKAIVKYLETKTDFQVTTSKDGKEAAKDIADNQPDVVVLDIFLPGKDGLKVLEELRNRNIDCPVIIFSNMSPDVVDVSRLAQLGVKKIYLKAETTLEKLVASIKEEV